VSSSTAMTYNAALGSVDGYDISVVMMAPNEYGSISYPGTGWLKIWFLHNYVSDTEYNVVPFYFSMDDDCRYTSGSARVSYFDGTQADAGDNFGSIENKPSNASGSVSVNVKEFTVTSVNEGTVDLTINFNGLALDLTGLDLPSSSSLEKRIKTILQNFRELPSIYFKGLLSISNKPDQMNLTDLSVKPKGSV
jgi:hypothetical protein